MWFDPPMEAAYLEGIVPALDDCGWTPYRVDRERYNGHIDNRIIAKIRSCGLLVADFTEGRQGVYYEAGFARGLGKRVVHTVARDSLKEVHFDISHINHVVWDDPTHLRAELTEHLQANDLLSVGPGAV